MPLPLYPNDSGEIIRHRAESIEHRVELKGPPFPEGLLLLKVPYRKGNFFGKSYFVIFVFFLVKYNRLAVDFA